MGGRHTGAAHCFGRWYFAFLRFQAGVDRLHVGGTSFEVTVLRSPEQLQKGLSGTDSLPRGRAMLFVFPHDDKWGIWMKDMNYAIDIVWLDSERRVVHLVKDAQPSSYPKTTFTPEKDSCYVIELPNGTIEQTGITIGEQADLPSGV